MLYDLEELLQELSGEDYEVVDVEPSTIVPATVPPAASSVTDQTNFEVSAADNFSVEYDRSFVVLQLIMCGLGVIGNLVMMFIVLALAEYKKAATHWYVFQLAITNIFFLLTIPFNVSEEINGSWMFPLWMCKAKETLLYLNFYSSVGFLTAMSIDRCLVTRQGFPRSQNRRSSFSAYATTTTIWILCLVMCAPEMIYTGLQATGENCRCTLEFKENSIKDECLNRNMQYGAAIDNIDAKEIEDENSDYSEVDTGIDDSDYYAWSTEKGSFTLKPAEDIFAPGCQYANAPKAFAAVTYFNMFGMFTLPVIAMIICYVLIVLHVRHSHSRRRLSSITTEEKNQQPDSSTSCASELDNQDNHLITAMCASMVFVFVVCWLPHHVQHLAKITGISGASSDYCESLSAVTTTLVFVNATICPFLYCFIGTRFGQRLRSAVSVARRSSRRRISFKQGHIHGQTSKQFSGNTSSRAGDNEKASTNGRYFDDEDHLIRSNHRPNGLEMKNSFHVPNQSTDGRNDCEV